MRTGYFRVGTLLVVMVAAAAVTVLMGYGSASAQDECQGDCEPPPPPPGTPTVVSTSPIDGATNVDRDANIKAKFSEKMKKSSINTSTVRVEEVGCDNPGNPCATPPVSPKVSYNAKKKLVTYNPGIRLEANTEYIATIEGGADGVKDRAGNPMAEDHTWTFTTEGGGCDIFC